MADKGKKSEKPKEETKVFILAPTTVDNGNGNLRLKIALAAQIPCLHFLYIFHCAMKNVVLPPQQYLLPTGYDEEGTFRNYHLLKVTLGDGVIHSIPATWPPDHYHCIFRSPKHGHNLRIEVMAFHEFTKQVCR